MSHRSIAMRLLIAALMLTGCGAARDTVSAPSPAPRTPTTRPATSPITSTAQPTRESLAPVEPPTAGASERGVTDTSTLISRYADLPQSRTPEGYYALGDPNAPVTMNHYSDFL